MEIQDFGEKIGGAKKDLWKERGLIIDDLTEMNEAEKSRLIKKDNVWKKPDYQKMVEDGIPVRVVYFIKMIRDATPTKPVITYRDNTKELIKEKQEGYISFVSNLRDYVMRLSTENEILNFYNDFLGQYIIRKENSYYIDIDPSAFGCIDNKLLSVAQIRNFNKIDMDIKKKQFCYTEDEKVLSQFNIWIYDNENIKFNIDYADRNVLEIKEQYGKRFIYPEDKFSNKNEWVENSIFITSQNGRIIKNNIESIEAAEQFLLSNYRERNNTQKRTRKKGFTPKQLENIVRDGENYRNGKDITGKDMMETFNFKGGEFGNWLSDNDRQQSLNFGYDALYDLSKALSILPKDISLGNRLSIAFGSRGSGNALAHYEPEREVINLTKMKGAGSLAHEWGHALDDIIGKNLGYKSFLSENCLKSDSLNETMRNLIETMKYKMVSGNEITEKQVEEYNKEINRLKNHIDIFFPKEYLNEEQTKQKEILIDNLVSKANIGHENLITYISEQKGNEEIEELSKLRKQTLGKGISKDERIRIAHLQNNLYMKKENIGKPQRVKTDFYKNSIAFDDMYAKTDHGYWQSTIEMFARSFACYVSDKLGYRSDYLCGHAELDLGFGVGKNNELELIKAFPENEERASINGKFEELINKLKEKNILHDYHKNIDYDDFDYEY